MAEFTDAQVDEIIAELKPVLERTGMTAADAGLFTAHFCNRMGGMPESAIHPIRKVLRNIPLSVFIAKKESIRNVCRQAAEDLRLLTASGEDASAEGSR